MRNRSFTFNEKSEKTHRYNLARQAKHESNGKVEVSWEGHFEQYKIHKPLEINKIPNLLKSRSVKCREADYLMNLYKSTHSQEDNNLCIKRRDKRRAIRFAGFN